MQCIEFTKDNQQQHLRVGAESAASVLGGSGGGGGSGVGGGSAGRLLQRHLSWLYHPPPAMQQGPREYIHLFHILVDIHCKTATH